MKKTLLTGALAGAVALAFPALARDLTDPVPHSGLRITQIDPAQISPGQTEAGHVSDRVAVQRAAFERSTFTEDRWRAMAAAPAYADGRCLVGFDDQDAAVAIVTVWSAGPGRQGLIEPMGVHRDHRGHGFGTTITLAAAAALRDLGSSSAVVVTPSSNVGGIATYRAAGFEPQDERFDLRRP